MMVICTIMDHSVPGWLSSLLHCPHSIRGIGSNHLIVLHNTQMLMHTFSSNSYHVLHYKSFKMFSSVWQFRSPQQLRTALARRHFHLHLPFWTHSKVFFFFLEFDPLGLTPFWQDGPFWYGRTHIVFRLGKLKYIFFLSFFLTMESLSTTVEIYFCIINEKDSLKKSIFRSLPSWSNMIENSENRKKSIFGAPI